MASAIRALVAIDESVDRKWIEAHLPGGSGVEVVAYTDSLRSGWNRLNDRGTDILVIACGDHNEEALELVSGSIDQRPERPVVVLCEASSNGFVRRAFEAGADDIVLLPSRDHEPATDEVLFILQKAVARKSDPADAAAGLAGTMVCVLGPKGGIGKTLTSCNLAVALAESGERVVLVDLDLQFGDLGLSLGLNPQKTLYDIVISGGSLDADKVEAYMATHTSGVRVLLAPARPDQAGVVTVDFLTELYRILRANNDYVIVDTPPGFTPEVIASIDASSHVCMVGMLDALSLKNTKLGLETLELMGYDRERIRMVLNRADSNVGITHNDVVAVIGRPPDVLVPSHRDITRSVNEGTPIVQSGKRSEAAKAFRSLAEIYRATRPKARGKRSDRSSLTRKET